MPELPEVEVTRRGIEPHVLGRTIASVTVREPRLRWRVPAAVHALAGREVRAVKRRGKYLLLDCGDGHLILHLGMSGSLRLVPPGDAPGKHDHVRPCASAAESCACAIRAASARCSGRTGPPEAHPLIRHLGVEPLSRGARRPAPARAHARKPRADQAVPDGRPARRRRRQHLRRPKACFSPASRRASAPAACRRKAARASRAAIKQTLRTAIRAGGSSLRDFVGSDGVYGCFQHRAWVYDRAGQACRKCGGAIRRIVQGQRATYYCPACQR